MLKIKILGTNPEVFEIRNHRFEIYKRSKLRGIHHPVANKIYARLLASLFSYAEKIATN